MNPHGNAIADALREWGGALMKVHPYDFDMDKGLSITFRYDWRRAQ